ncbi:MAG: choice-of-anchor Q domain-containing protein [Aggregatilineales bacterium]
MFRRLSALSLVVLFALAFAPAYAQQANPATNTIVVTNLNDSGAGSLRQAISDSTDGGAITFSVGLSGTIAISKPIELIRNLTIQGPTSSVLAISNTKDSGVFVINLTVNVHLSNLTISDSGHRSSYGGLSNAKGTVYMSNMVFKNNEAPFGGAMDNGGTMIISNSQFIGNKGPGGGAIFNVGTIAITNTSFEGNNIVLDNRGTITISNSTLYNNLSYPDYVVTNWDNSSATFVNDTFYKNTGIIRNGGQAVFINSSLFDNNYVLNPYSPNPNAADPAVVTGISPASLTFKNTIIAALSSTIIPNCRGPITDGAGNLQFPGSDCGAAIRTGDSKFAPLANNGGSTQTLALLPGSAAIGAADQSTCQGNLVNGLDQRGLSRVSPCDAGAFQTNAVPVSVATLAPTVPSTPALAN